MGTPEGALKYAPEFRFDSRVITYPVSIENLVENSKVEKDGERVPVEFPLVEPVHLYPDPRYFLEQEKKTTLYWHSYEEDDFIIYVYILIYAVNPGYSTCGYTMGSYHTGDVEHVSVFTNEEGIQKIYYAAHGSTQGTIVSEGKIEKTISWQPDRVRSSWITRILSKSRYILSFIWIRQRSL